MYLNNNNNINIKYWDYIFKFYIEKLRKILKNFRKNFKMSETFQITQKNILENLVNFYKFREYLKNFKKLETSTVELL